MNEIQKETNDAIERGLQSANLRWRQLVMEKLKEFCEVTETFTMNEFRIYTTGFQVQTHDKRAMGGIVKTALKEEWIEPTGRTIISRVGHKSLLQIWRSKLYQPKTTLF